MAKGFINIDTVYQKVLVIANKEQRGYITPQEFNLYANQAQQEIFEQYFYDLNQQARIPGNEYVYADVDDMLEEKLQIFENTDTTTEVALYNTFGSVGFVIPDYMYRISKIEFDHYNGAGTLIATRDVEILKTTDFRNCINGGPLTMPDNYRPIANIRNNILRIVGGTTFNPSIPIINPLLVSSIIYFQKPSEVAWGYFIVGGKALYDTQIYDPNTGTGKTKHFELHMSEENELVYKILKYAGVSMRRDDVATRAQQLELSQVQQEKQ